MQDRPEEVNLERMLGVLRRRAPWILLCVVLTAGAAFAYSKQQTKEYKATASVVFNENQLSQQVAGLQPAVANNAEAIQATNVKLLQFGQAAAKTASLLGHGLTTKSVQDSLSITAVEKTNVVNVSATSTSPRLAAAIANTYARQFVKQQQNSTHSYVSSALALVNKQLAALSPQQAVEPAGLALQGRAQSLRILAKLRSGNVQFAQAATVPTSPSSPKVAKSTIFGVVLGLLLGLAIAFLLERLNRHLRDPEEAQEAFDLPVVGTVPESKAIMASNQGAAAAELPFVENEAFRMLRASLRYFNVDRPVRSVLVTSHDPEVGKSTIAWHLARIAATSSKVIVVETDLRNPSLARQHGLNLVPGLAELLTQQIGLEGAIQAKPIGTDGAASALDVIVAGASPPNPADLIASETMSKVLADLAERYELVVIDTAPLGAVADAYPLLLKVGGVIVVARMGKTTRDSAERVREQLAQLQAPVLGIVANGIKARRGKYGYGSYGGYHQAPAEQGGAVGADVSVEPEVPGGGYHQGEAEPDGAVEPAAGADPAAPVLWIDRPTK